ncbi:exodeoxyribonuclease I [Candidatus Saccharibacteria bacterium]|nr:exodeoxyribonuclease I [Candidatus Saccharibacteria bacterium]
MVVQNKTFFFYDLETSGLNPRADRIMQFAGQRTDLVLNPIGEPVNILVRLTEDALPSPAAIMVTKITPQQTLREGVSEKEFADLVCEEIFTPNTIAVGYNTIRFDDEFMRALLWRNFYDAYEWEWKDGRSRWDLLDVVRLTRALRPEGINWPVTEEGRPTNRLELLTKLNGLSHEHAHDALSDVFATMAVAKMINEKQPKLFKYLLKMRDKNEVKKLVNLDNKQPFVYVSGRYAAEYNKATVAFPLTSGRNGNVLVFDLRYDLETLLKRAEASEESVHEGQAGEEKTARSAHGFFPIVKELCFNKCPAVAPMTVLSEGDGWRKLGLSQEGVEKNLAILLKHPEFAERVREELEARPEWPKAEEPEMALYEGFLNEPDRVKVAAVRNAEPNRLTDFYPEFDDERLPELLLHYKGRNFPQTLSEHENQKWEAYRRARLERQAPKFLAELERVYQQDEYIGEELKLYFESLFSADD